MKRIYFDNAASTPLDPRVLDAMKPYFLTEFGNPGSLHSYGQQAIAAVDASREAIAHMIGARFREIVFTASATEANNLAIKGVVNFYKNNNQSADQSAPRPRVIISAIEHESVFETAQAIKEYGVEVVMVPVTSNGILDLEALKAALTPSTILVSVMYVNNEIGSIQPIKEIHKIIAEYKQAQNAIPGGSNGAGGTTMYPLLHTDAAQAFQFFDCDVNKLGVDMMTLSAHKVYGPKGIGALYVHRDAKGNVPIVAQTTGGGQEFGLRSGTENVPSIVGFTKAMELAVAERETISQQLKELKEALWNEIKKISPMAEVSGSFDHSGEHSAPHILNVYFPEQEAQDLLIQLDRADVAVSSGSACRSRAVEPSYVIQALGYDVTRAKQSLRFSFGKENTKSEVTRAAKLFSKILRNK